MVNNRYWKRYHACILREKQRSFYAEYDHCSAGRKNAFRHYKSSNRLRVFLSGSFFGSFVFSYPYYPNRMRHDYVRWTQRCFCCTSGIGWRRQWRSVRHWPRDRVVQSEATMGGLNGSRGFHRSFEIIGYKNVEATSWVQTLQDILNTLPIFIQTRKATNTSITRSIYF